ncbi:unnamed protein product [Rhizophagus irregularis]|nr:unnamed protein product [Rhizophagus irregularis]
MGEWESRKADRKTLKNWTRRQKKKQEEITLAAIMVLKHQETKMFQEHRRDPCHHRHKSKRQERSREIEKTQRKKDSPKPTTVNNNEISLTPGVCSAFT